MKILFISRKGYINSIKLLSPCLIIHYIYKTFSLFKSVQNSTFFRNIFVGRIPKCVTSQVILYLKALCWRNYSLRVYPTACGYNEYFSGTSQVYPTACGFNDYFSGTAWGYPTACNYNAYFSGTARVYPTACGYNEYFSGTARVYPTLCSGKVNS